MNIPPKLFNDFLQFRAGKMTYSNGIVSPDTRQGYLSFVFKDQKSIELIWTSGKARESIVLEKGKVVVSYVEQCKTGRVLLFNIKLADGERKSFFWMQDKSEAMDAEYLAKLQGVLGPLETASTGPKVNLQDLERIMANIATNITFADVLSSPKLTEVLKADAAFYLERISEFLPNSSGATSIIDEVKNPQVGFAAASLDAALQDPMVYRELIQAFGIPEVSPQSGSTAFLQGILKQSKSE